MPVVATILSMAILLQLGLCPTQFLFYTAWERMTIQNPPATNGDLGKERGMPELTRTIQDGSHTGEVMEVVERRVFGGTASFSAMRWVGLGMG